MKTWGDFLIAHIIDSLTGSKGAPKTVEDLLEAAKHAAKPLKDPGLEKKIDTAIEHVTTRSNPRTG